jgi:hypothetical protein
MLRVGRTAKLHGQSILKMADSGQRFQQLGARLMANLHHSGLLLDKLLPELVDRQLSVQEVAGEKEGQCAEAEERPSQSWAAQDNGIGKGRRVHQQGRTRGNIKMTVMASSHRSSSRRSDNSVNNSHD